jgi:hypothetical protein
MIRVKGTTIPLRNGEEEGTKSRKPALETKSRKPLVDMKSRKPVGKTKQKQPPSSAVKRRQETAVETTSNLDRNREQRRTGSLL